MEEKKWIKYQEEPKDRVKISDLLEEYGGYKPPISVIYEQVEKDFDNAVFGAVLNVNINVDREDLIKALKYDRGQYNKGYNDGCKATAKGIFDSIFETLCVFATKGKSEEYNEGFLEAVSQIDERLQKLAKEKGVEVE